MNVAVTGSSGLIGSALVDALRGRGERVVRLVRHATAGPDEIAWDPAAGTIDAAALEGIDAVVHLAGARIAARRWSADYKLQIERSRTEGTALLAQTLAQLTRPPRVFLCGSAIGFYGDRGAEILSEEAAAGSGFLAQVVQRWEAAAQPAIDAGIRTLFARTGVVLSTHGGALAKQLPIFRLGLGGLLGAGTQYFSWITLEDEVRALLHLLHTEVHGAVNLTAPHPVTNREFTRTLGAALHRPTLLPVPRFAPRLLLGEEMAQALLFDSARVVPSVLRGDGFAFAHTDIAAALQSMLIDR